MSQPNSSVLRITKKLQQQVLAGVPPKLQPLAKFGLRSLMLTPFTSCNGNARMSHGSRQAAEMRMYRLLRHEALGNHLMQALQQQLPLNNQSVLNLDFSNFGGVAALVAALQTNQGRAVPWIFKTLVSNTQGFKRDHPQYRQRKVAYQEWKQTFGGDQHDVVLRLVDQIDESPYTTRPPKIVCDRGFGNRRILSHLFGRAGMSYVRFRDDFQVKLSDNTTICAGNLPIGDYQVRWRGLQFRLVVIATHHEVGVSPWIIATNDQASTAKQIAKLYYRRFEIEETFRDWKSCFGFGKSRFSRWQSLATILSFASLAIWLAWLTAQRLSSSEQTHPKQTYYAKQKLSFVRIWQETIQSYLRQQGLRYLVGAG